MSHPFRIKVLSAVLVFSSILAGVNIFFQWGMVGDRDEFLLSPFHLFDCFRIRKLR